MTVYELPPEPVPGRRLRSGDGSVWLRDDVDPVRRWRREVNDRGERVDPQHATRLSFAGLLETYGRMVAVPLPEAGPDVPA